MNEFYETPIAKEDELTVTDIIGTLFKEQSARKPDENGAMDSGARIVSEHPRDRWVTIDDRSTVSKMTNGKAMTNAFWYKYGLVASITAGIAEAQKDNGDPALLKKCIQHVRDHPDEIIDESTQTQAIQFLEQQLTPR